VGIHTVTVTDANACSASGTAEIAQKILPELTAENLEKGEAVRMEKLLFEADSSSIDASSIPTLEELYNFLYDNPTIVVEVGGHTNGLPEHDYCDQLSTARAKAVAEYIIGKGIDAKRIIYKGYGKRQPIATNMTPEGRRRNQRVEVKTVKLSE
jgi:outer membrane protein OmpA-like peptidoglycan-associated protein